MEGPKVFVSFDEHDATFAHRFMGDLNSAGANVWASREKNTDEEQTNQALKSCQWFIVVLSPAALRSPWMRLETNAAIKLKMQGKIREILPIVAQPVNPDDIPPTWDTFQRFDATSDYQGVLAKITRVIGLTTHPGQSPYQPTVTANPPVPAARRRKAHPGMVALIALLLLFGTTLAVLGASHPQLFASQPTPITNLHPTATIPLPSPTPSSRLLTAAQRQAIRTVVQRFCNDIQWRNYQDAYSLLSSALRLKVTQNTFVKDEQYLDTTPGPLVACTLIQDSSENTITGNLVVYLLQTKRESLPTTSGAVALVYEDNAWRINAIGSILNLANPYAGA